MAMTVEEMIAKLQSIAIKYKDAPVKFDTEARTFDVNLVDVDDCDLVGVADDGEVYIDPYVTLTSNAVRYGRIKLSVFDGDGS